MGDRHDNHGAGMIGDAELMALVDGQLDRDPNYKAWLEKAIEHDTALARRACIFGAQTEALRAAYEPRLSEPIPPRLLAALETDAPRHARRGAWAIAVSITIAVAAGSFGWTAARWQSAQNGATGHWDTAAVYESAHQSAPSAQPSVVSDRSEGPATGNRRESTRLPGDNGSGLPEWLAQEMSLKIRLPDLSSFGYRLVSRDDLEIDGTRVLRLDYRDNAGRAFNLFLRPRWSGEQTDIRVTRKDGIAFASWVDGPLSSAIATQRPKPEAMALATMIRRALQESAQGNTVAAERPLPPGIPGPSGIPESSHPANDTAGGNPFEIPPVVPRPKNDRQSALPLPSGTAIPAKMGTDPGATPVRP